ncbi:MAG: DnaJ domain-containing protein [FCB group bacterium]|nr:DnaJ domain-containing protein [FCB group bacterium]
MSNWSKFLWGGVGWALGGPIGGILAYAIASMADGGGRQTPRTSQYTQTRAGDFGLSLLVLFGAVMKADEQVLKSELDYVKAFFVKQFGREYASDRIRLFREIIKQDYPLRDVCLQIKRNMDHPARLELLHVLFGLAQADGQVDPREVAIIQKIANYLGINSTNYESIKAMFIKNNLGNYQILGITPDAADAEVKRAYRAMANKYHPDKVVHLGEDFQRMAEEKFKKVNQAYQDIKKERGFA